jgi:hypothetical protein
VASAEATVAGKSGRAVALLLVPGAAVVAVVMLVLRVHVQPLTIPTYSIAAGSTTELRPGEQFLLELDPQGPLTGAVMAKAFLLRGTTLQAWNPVFEVDKDGTIRVMGPVDTLFAGVPAGEWELDVVVGRPEQLPRNPDDAMKGRDAQVSGGAWQLLHERLRVGAGG